MSGDEAAEAARWVARWSAASNDEREDLLGTVVGVISRMKDRQLAARLADDLGVCIFGPPDDEAAPKRSTFRERQGDAQYEVIGQISPEALAEILAPGDTTTEGA